MFDSEFFERFSRVHPAVPALLYLPVAAVSVAIALFENQLPVWRVAAEVFGGYLFWTLFEYWLHRLFFHMPVVGPKTKRVHFFVHGVHHDYPWDETRLVIPPGASLGICVVVYMTFRVVFGAEAMYGPFAGFVVGYVHYDTVHWYIHAKVPKTRFGRWLRREHLIHHFKEPTSRFGVSCPWLDFVFGTRGQPATRGSTDNLSARREQDPDSLPLPG